MQSYRLKLAPSFTLNSFYHFRNNIYIQRAFLKVAFQLSFIRCSCAIIDNSHLKVNYTFRVIAKNSHGESDPGYKDGAICRTKESFPYGNPSNVTAEGNEPNNLVIRWIPMDKYEWNAPDLHYIVRYRLNQQGAQWKETHIEDPLAVTLQDIQYFVILVC